MASRPRTAPRTAARQTTSALTAGLKGGLSPQQIAQVLRGKPARALTVAGERRALALAELHKAGEQGGQ